MKRDLDALMMARNLDAMMVSGKALGNPPLVYLLNGVRVTHALVIKKLGQDPTVIVNPMERELAEDAGYPVVLTTRYDYGGLLGHHAGDALAASVAYYGRVFDDLGVVGRVGVYGYLDQGYAYALLSAIDAAFPTIEIVGEVQGNLIRTARATKDPAEVARIREVGQRTATIVHETVAFLQAHAVGDGEILVKAGGSPLTVGDVHAKIARLIALQGLEDPEGFIFSTGRDAAIPHSRGKLSAPMRLGESIVFDIFPRELGGGYFFDLTRTFCLGYAPEAVQRLHRDVVACQDALKAALRVGEKARTYQQLTCSFFSARGHPTLKEDPATQRGYVHGIAHGVGLDIHEAPGFQDEPGNATELQPGHLFAMEPGLYYPDEGMGCRMEDVFWIADDGQIHNLTEFPYELVVPMDGGKAL